MRRALVAAVPLAAALTLTGCVPQASPDQAETTRSHSTAPTPAQTSESTGPVDDATPIPVPEAGTDSQASAVAAAEKTLVTFAQPTLSAEEWMNQMTPLLSPAGYEAYIGTDPAQIPVHQVTGTGVILAASTDVSLIVQVPTDAGTYNVTLTRTDPPAAWLAERIRPAKG